MITITIGSEQRDINNWDENWINQQINSRRNAGVPICIKVAIRLAAANLTLTTPDCPKFGGGRLPTEPEKEIFELWEKRGLNQNNFPGGNLVAFLKQLGINNYKE